MSDSDSTGHGEGVGCVLGLQDLCVSHSRHILLTPHILAHVILARRLRNRPRNAG